MPEEIPSELAPTQTPDVTGADPAILMGAILVAMLFGLAMIALIMVLVQMRKGEPWRPPVQKTVGWGLALWLVTLGVFTADWWWFVAAAVVGAPIVALADFKPKRSNAQKPSRLRKAIRAFRENEDDEASA